LNKKSQPPRPLKKPYAAPKLIRYGDVRTLTQAGATGVMESMGGMKASSCLLKENLVRIGTHPLGIGLYLFDYKPEFRASWGHGRQFGVIAEEVESIMPRAVSRDPRGYLTVDYAMLGIRCSVQ